MKVVVSGNDSCIFRYVLKKIRLAKQTEKFKKTALQEVSNSLIFNCTFNCI